MGLTIPSLISAWIRRYSSLSSSVAGRTAGRLCIRMYVRSHLAYWGVLIQIKQYSPMRISFLVFVNRPILCGQYKKEACKG